MAYFRTGVVLEGADGLKKAMDRLKRVFPEAGAKGLYVLGEEVIINAKTRTPVLTGKLQRSAYVRRPQKTHGGRYVAVEIGYGNRGHAAEYALIQHENDWYRHRVGEAHFLLNAINHVLAMGNRRLRDIVKQQLNL